MPQSAIAQECLFDKLAEKLGMNVLEFRILNALKNDVATVCRRVFAQGGGITQCRNALRPAWAQEGADCAAFNPNNTVVKHGVGLAAAWYGCGNTSLLNPSTIKSGIRGDGKVALHQGANTVITQVFATALGSPRSRSR